MTRPAYVPPKGQRRRLWTPLEYIGSHQNERAGRAGRRVFNLYTHRLLGLNFDDTQCALKAFKRNAARELFAHRSIEGWGFDPELLFVAARLGYKVAEVHIKLHHDYSTTKFRLWRDCFNTSRDLLQILSRSLLESYPRQVRAPAVIRVPATSPAELPPMHPNPVRSQIEKSVFGG